MIRRLTTVMVGLVLLTGCGVSVPTPGQFQEPTTSVPVPVAVPRPAKMVIPAINAESTLIPLGLNPDKTFAVPPVSNPKQASWFDGGPTPGDPGPAVILGHIDGHKIEGIFWRLKELKPGDVVEIFYVDNSERDFHVTRNIQAPKNKFPATEVLGFTPDPELRLITCGGAFDPHGAADGTGSYLSNTIVFAA
jgi:hypothetical protein